MGPVFNALVLVMVALIGLVVTPVAVLGLVLRQRRAVGVERAQLQWLSLAAVVTLVFGVAAGAARQPAQEALWALAFSAIPVGIVIAVVRYRLFDVEVVLNRTVVYGLLTLVVLAGYLAVVVGVDQAAQRTGLVAVVVLALLAAAARDRVQRGVDRLLFGYRKDPYVVVSRVGRRLDDASGPLDALRQLTVELRTVLRLPFAEVLPDDPGLPPVESGRSVAGTVDVPVTVQGQHVATLRVGRRHNGERFRPDEMSALTDVARHVGALVQAAALIAELQRSRETLVTGATARICAAQPHPAVLVLTMSDDDDSVFAALRAGARGYLLKESSSEDITRAVRSVARGEAVFGPKIADRVVGFFAAAAHGRGPDPFPQLTAREREILDLLARGWDNVTIARRLVVSDKTVRNHVSAVLTKLQVASRAEAVALARDAGIGPVP